MQALFLFSCVVRQTLHCIKKFKHPLPLKIKFINTRCRLNILFSCMKTWDGNKPVGFEAGERQKPSSIYLPATSKPRDRHKHMQAVKVRYVVHGYLSQEGEGSDKGAAALFC